MIDIEGLGIDDYYEMWLNLSSLVEILKKENAKLETENKELKLQNAELKKQNSELIRKFADEK